MGEPRAPRTTPPQPREPQSALAQDIHDQAAEIAEEIAALLADLPAEQVFGHTELLIRDKVLQLVARSLAAKLGQKKNGYHGSSIDCPRCGKTAGFHGYRERNPLSIGGSVRCNRAYYLCRSCGQGHCPFDQAVGLPEANVTPAVERLTALAGAVSDSFERGSELLAEMAGVRLCESTVQRATEAVGQRIAGALAAGRRFGPDHPWKFYHDALGRSIAYIQVDATGVRQQGPHGEQVDGRMAYVGMIGNPLPDPERCFSDRRRPGERMAARYVSGLYPLADMGPLLRQQAAQVGLDEAEVWVAISDGGAGLEDFLASNFPRVEVVILDYWHVAERLAGLAAVLHALDQGQAQQQAKEWSRILKDEGGITLIAVLEAWPWPERVAGLKAAREEVMTYLKNQVHRMDYPTYEANGWYIGSGGIESACKTVVGQRLKGAGMRWSERGAHEVCHVRALYRSEPSQWSAFWQRDVRP